MPAKLPRHIPQTPTEFLRSRARTWLNYDFVAHIRYQQEPGDHHKIYAWLEANCQGRWDFRLVGDDLCWCFTHQQDALIFALAWGGSRI